MKIVYNRTIGINPGEEIIFEGDCSLYQAYIKKYMFIMQQLTECETSKHCNDLDLIEMEMDLEKNIKI